MTSKGATIDVGAWLRDLGLGQYEATFRENAINEKVLPNLTAEDLKDVGIGIVGHRRMLLDAIGALPAGADAKPPTPSSTPLSTPPVAAASTPDSAGERRHVTVMFCDLVDSTGIAAKLDAEEWRDLVGAYIDAASAAVVDMGGKVAKKLGDGLMALFGYPVAQENDAERAVRAALAIQRALADLNRKNANTGKPALAARVAIDSGPVVVDAAGEIFGEVPNVAARAQAVAEPGSVVVTARVQRQIAGLFVAEDRAHELKACLSRQRPRTADHLKTDISRGAIYRVKSPIQRVHKAEIQPGVGGDAGNNRLAHKARPARVRRRICGERHRRLGPSPSYRSGPQGHRRLARASTKDARRDQRGCCRYRFRAESLRT
jgi:class 3 adenylate cyclase